MAINVGANTLQSNVVVHIDPYDRLNGDTGCGGGAFTNHNQGQKNLVNPSNVYAYLNGVHLQFEDDYPVTIKTNTYPESNYGAYGLKQGFNNLNGTQDHSFTRALHFYVWVDGEGWLPSTHFNGSRRDGYCYDNYSSNATTELPKFHADYNRIKQAYPDSTYILVGGHAADNYQAETTEIMVDLGAPSDVLNWDPSPGRPEFVLVGKPGLGAGNAYGWAYQNIDANQAQLNFILPANKGGDLVFDGTSDYMELPDPGVGARFFSIEIVVKPDSVSGSPMLICPNSNGIDQFLRLNTDNSVDFYVAERADVGGREVKTPANTVPNGQYTHIVAVREGRYLKLYINGVESASYDDGDRVQGEWSGLWRIAQRGNGSYYYNGAIGLLKVYTKDLNATEVAQAFNQVKSRFGL